MNWKTLPVGVKAVLGSLLFLILGILALWFTKVILKEDQPVVLACVIFLPIIVYLILSGILREITIPGGTSIKLSDIAQKSLLNQDEWNAKQVPLKQIDFMSAFPVLKGSVNQDVLFGDDLEGGSKEKPTQGKMPDASSKSTIKSLDLLPEVSLDNYARYIVLTVMLECSSIHYQTSSIVKYLIELSKYRNFKFLVILEKDEKVFAYKSAWEVLNLLQAETMSDNFAEFINKGYKQGLLQRYDFIDKAVQVTDTNIQALEIMNDLKTDAVVVTDEIGMFKGVIEREQILSMLILALAKSVS